MRRVVVTGLGIVSCIGNTLNEVEQSLRTGRAGLRFVPEYAELGMCSAVAGIPDIGNEPPVDRKIRRFMADAALYAWHAACKAIDDAGLASGAIAHPRTGLIVGSGTGSVLEHHLAVETMRTRGVAKVLPYGVPRMMGSTTSACLATGLGIRGASYSITSACATSAHCIGHAADLIKLDRQDIVLAGGAEEIAWTTAMPFDAMGALASVSRDATASRPYDSSRNGFVIAGGGAILVLEELGHALARKAKIYGELSGYGACSDGMDMVTPSVEGAARAMRLALATHGDSVGYINTHATSTVRGDVNELAAVREVFGEQVPPLSSTKGLTGHSIGAAGAHEAVYSLLMLDRGFLAGCAHLQDVDRACAGFPLLRQATERRVDSVMSNSFGFGGTNASLVFRQLS
jgi:3-oxoacyl-[acyl-carrier-protein] synthase-1